jgi:hypothetical protein
MDGDIAGQLRGPLPIVVHEYWYVVDGFSTAGADVMPFA